MPTLKELAERRAPIGAEIRKMADILGDSKPDFTAEERSKWDKLNNEFNSLTSQMEVVRRGEEVGGLLGSSSGTGERRGNKPGLEDTEPRTKKSGRSARERQREGEEIRALAFQGWCRRQHGMELTVEQRRACKATGLNPNKRYLDITLPRRPAKEQRALSNLTGSAGAYTIPQGFVYNLETALKAFNGLRQVADVMRTESGNPMPWPTVNDTGNVGNIVGQNTAVATNEDPPFGQTMFGAWKYTSNMVLVPEELMEDSAFDLGEELGMMLGTRIGRGQEADFSNGNGTTAPQGVTVGANLGVTAASDTAIAPDEIISLIHSVDPAYRKDPSVAFMFHDQILAVIRKLKDSVGRYLFEEGQNGAPDKLKGHPIVINQNMASTLASGNKTMVFGAFKKYKIRDVRQMRLRKLVERYADADQTGFCAFLRSDGKVLDAGNHPIAYYVHP